MEGLVVRSIEEAIDNKISASVKESEEINAVVTRVDKDGTIWFHIPGGEDETPAKSTTSNVNPGDVVSVTISGGKATVSGNLTNPSMTSSDVVKIVDDAIEAKSVKAEEGVFERLFAGSKTVQQIKAALSDARKVATDFLSFDSSNGLVVGNLEGSTLGGNVQITGTPAVNIRDGSKTLASFEGDGITFMSEDVPVRVRNRDMRAVVESEHTYHSNELGDSTALSSITIDPLHEPYWPDRPPRISMDIFDVDKSVPGIESYEHVAGIELDGYKFEDWDDVTGDEIITYQGGVTFRNVKRVDLDGAEQSWRDALRLGDLSTKSTLAASDIPNLNASKITAGTLAYARGGTSTGTSGSWRYVRFNSNFVIMWKYENNISSGTFSYWSGSSGVKWAANTYSVGSYPFMLTNPVEFCTSVNSTDSVFNVIKTRPNSSTGGVYYVCIPGGSRTASLSNGQFTVVFGTISS